MSLPITPGQVRPRLIVFIKDGPITSALADSVEAREDHFELLIRAIQQAEHVEQIETFATQGRLAAATIHEARNRLQIVQALASTTQTSLEHQTPSQALLDIERLRSNLHTLGQILTDGLEYVRPDRRGLTNVDRVVQQVVANMRGVAVDVYKKERPAIIFKPYGSRIVTTLSPSPLEQALINLIGNALDFLRDELWAQIRVQVEVNMHDIKTPIHIYVSDNGPGLSASNIRRLFEPRRSAKGRVGTGLGLYVSRNLLRMFGGELELHRTARWGGAVFRIRLPVLVGALDDELNRGDAD